MLEFVFTFDNKLEELELEGSVIDGGVDEIDGGVDEIEGGVGEIEGGVDEIEGGVELVEEEVGVDTIGCNSSMRNPFTFCFFISNQGNHKVKEFVRNVSELIPPQ